MKYALIGYGKMARAVAEAANARGHRCVAVVDPAVRAPGVRSSLDPRRLGGANVAFEFSVPAAAEANVVALLEARVAVVCGTTGWSGGSRAIRSASRRTGLGAVIAPNFSVGMALFEEIVGEAARRLARARLYEPYVVEWHHRAKKDAPSGTALRLAHRVAREAGETTAVRAGEPSPALRRGDVHVSSVRAGHEPGIHEVGFDGEHDVVRLVHRARGRGGLALGAVLAAEWIVGRSGVHGFQRVVADLLRRGGGA